MNKNIPPSLFSKWLIRANHIDESEFHRWFFYPGMLFGSISTWWKGKANRPGPHEGLDLAFYCNAQNTVNPVPMKMKIPVMYTGIVRGISNDDFIGQSIYVCHPQFTNDNGNALYSIYAHSRGCDFLTEGMTVDESDIIAVVADFSQTRAKMPPHLHLSMAFLPPHFPKENMNWKTMADPDSVHLVNPLDFLELNYTIQEYVHSLN